MINVNVSVLLMGSNHVLNSGQVDNWEDIIGLFPNNKSCTFEINYADVIYTGAITKSEDGTKLLVVFDETDITLPAGMCLIVNCDSSEEEPEGCPNTQQMLTEDTKLAVLGDDGCPIGYVTFGQITGSLSKTLCQILGVSEIPSGNLTSSDRILTTSGGCTLKSVPASDIACP